MPGYKSAAGSRVSAMLQKELPPVAFLQQRPHRLPALRAFRLSTSRGRKGKGVVLIQQNYKLEIARRSNGIPHSYSCIRGFFSMELFIIATNARINFFIHGLF